MKTKKKKQMTKILLQRLKGLVYLILASSYTCWGLFQAEIIPVIFLKNEGEKKGKNIWIQKGLNKLHQVEQEKKM